MNELEQALQWFVEDKRIMACLTVTGGTAESECHAACGRIREKEASGEDVPLGEDTLFDLASLTKIFTGMAVLRANGYEVPASPLLTSTGLVSILLAPFGSHGIHMAAISAAICAGPEAHEDPRKRYTAAVWCGVFYGIAGIFGATLASLFAALPAALILSIAALALFASIIGGLTQAMSEPNEREAALITFLVTASGMTLAGVGSAFWGIVAGLLTLAVLNWGKR